MSDTGPGLLRRAFASVKRRSPLVLLIIGIFAWSVKSGQFDDLEGPAHRILMDDDDPPPKE